MALCTIPLAEQFDNVPAEVRQSWLDKLTVKELSQLELERFILPRFHLAAEKLEAAVYSGDVLAVTAAYQAQAAMVDRACGCLLAGAVPPARY